MAIKIGHAAGDERRKASGGVAGDQTGGEVTIGRWYSSPWDTVLRPTDPDIAEKSALACEAGCANPAIGYDQGARNSLYNYAKLVDFNLAAVKDLCECDCSSFMHVCGIAGGADLPFSWNCFWTGNMVEGFLKSGKYIALAEAKYLSSDAYLRRGDILVNSKSHTAMALENGAKAYAEDEDEAVPVAPSQPANADGSPQRGEPITMQTALPLLKQGHIGGAVWAMQTLLTDRGCSTGGVDSEFGPMTDKALRAFQSSKGLEADGECGALTWAALING